MSKRFSLAVLNSHPIQYFAPLYRRIEQTDDIAITVYYCSRRGLDPGFVDPGFGRVVVWDVPLLEGYGHRFLPNYGIDRGPHGMLSLVNPSIVTELRRGHHDALLVHGHNSVSNLLAMAAAKLSGTRIFMRGETHLGLKRGAAKRLARGPVLGLLYGQCDACLYIGSRNRAFYEAHGVPAEKLFFVPYTIDNESFAQRAAAECGPANRTREKLGLPPSLPVILFASKLTERKRPLDALLAHSELGRRGVDAALVIVGDGEQRAMLEARARELGSRNVVFAGFANQREMPAYFAFADVFVLPSENEPWGLVINEAMACGVPVVATSEVGAAADLVEEGVTGYTFPVGDIGRLADALQEILRPGGRGQSMRDACKRRMASWSYEEDVRGIRAALVETTSAGR